MPLLTAGLGLIGKLFGGGSSAPPGPTVAGDASAGLDAPFQYGGQFVVGGSGKTDATNSQSQTPSSGASGGIDPMTIYVAFGVVGLIAIIALIGARRK